MKTPLTNPLGLKRILTGVKAAILTVALMMAAQFSNGHGVQVAYCLQSNGFLRVYIEHWHGTLSQANLSNNGATIQTDIGGTIVTQSLDADGFANNTSVNNLPGCENNITVLTACAGLANTYNNWVYYDFAPPAFGQQISIVIRQGNTALLTEACPDLFPTAPITATFIDTQGPALDCADVNVTGCAPTVVNFNKTVIDNSDPNPTVTYSPADGSVFQPGTTVVTANGIDNLGNTSTCTFNVNVSPPTGFDCTASTTPSDCANNTGTLNINAFGGTAPYEYSIDGGANYGPGSSFSGLAPGTYSVMVSDAAGCISDAKDVTVGSTDNTPPTISCPFDIVVNADPGLCGAYVNYTVPSATDNCSTNGLPTSLPGYSYQGTHGSSTYFLSNTQTDPESAHAAAVGLGGHLATITDAAENNFIANFISDKIWIGATDRDSEGNWGWITSEPYTYTNWAPSEPNNYGGNEDWAVINWSGVNPDWNDWFFTALAYYAVEFDGGSVPTSLQSGYASGDFFPLGTTTVTYQATDDAGNTSTCSFTVTVNDTEAPNMVCQDITVNLDASGFASITAADIDGGSSDNCSLSLAAIGQTTFDCNDNNQTVQVTLTGTDQAGNMGSCVANVTVADPLGACCALPQAVCSNYTLSLDGSGNGSITAANVDGGSTADCGLQSLVVSPSNFNCGNIGNNNVTLTITDIYGANSSCSATVTVVDNTPPLLDCPEDAELECDEDSSPANTGMATATDNCNGAPTITYSDEIEYGSCSNEYLITRTWTATDAHGNSTECDQEILVQDTQAPVLSCPADATLECTASTSPDATGVATATDNCSSSGTGTSIWINEFHYDNSGSDVGEFVEVAGSAGLDLSDYDIVLYNGSNGTTYNTVNLSGSIDDESLGFGAVSVAIAGIQNGSPDGIALVGPAGVVEFISYEGSFTATNGPANGMTSTDVGITEPTNTPIGESLQLQGIGNTSGDFSWQDAAESPGDLNAGQSISSPASAGVTITFSDVVTNGACPNTRSIARTWTATDECGNTSSCTQTIDVVDSTAPEFVDFPESLELECDEDNSPANTGTPGAIDNCGPSPWINEFHYDNDGSDVGEFFEIAGLANVDLSGYSVVLYNGANGLAYNTINLSGSIDNEGNGYGAVDFNATGLQNGGPDGLALVGPDGLISFLSYEGSFTANDGPAAGVTSTNVGVSENSGTPAGESLQLTGSGSSSSDFAWSGPAAASPGSLNNGQNASGGAAPVITYSDEIEQGACPNQYLITRTWTATDACGNSVSEDQEILMDDTTNPILTLPDDVELECDQNPAPEADGGQASATDNCGSVTISYTDEVEQGSCINEYLITRTWTAVDECGNTSTGDQEILVQDTEAPVISCPANVTLECTASTFPDATGVATATDNCSTGSGDNQAIWINEFHYDNSGSDVGEFVEVAGSAGTDLADYELVLYNGSNGAPYNTVALSGIIDNESLGLGAVSFAIAGIQNGGPDGIALAEVGGDLVEFISYEGSFIGVGGPADGVTSTDVGITEPSTTPIGESLQLVGTGNQPGDFSWQDAAESPGDLNAGQTVTQPAAGGVTVTFTDVETAGACANERTITRTWTATDECGNSSSCVQTIEVVDTTAPEFVDFPDALELECDEDNSPASTGTPGALDNCGPSPWINELHYDNDGSDVGEFFEIAGLANVDLSAYSVVLYNGSNGLAYNTIALSGTIDDEGTGYGAIDFQLPSNGLQNGGPDGLALVGPTGVVSFLSYEGSFTANDGPAAGATSMDIGVSETSGTAVGSSLQRVGASACGDGFTWSGPAAASPGSLNAGQTVSGGSAPVITYADAIEQGDCPNQYLITRTWTATDACGNSVSEDQEIFIDDTTNPTIDAGAIDLTVECDGAGNAAELNAWLSSNAGATASDNCGAVTWSNDFAALSDDCGATGSATVTFTATDDCGNSSSTSATFTIEDTTAPSVASASDMTVECDGAGNSAALNAWLGSNGGASASDACSGVTWSNDFAGLSDDCGATGSATVTFTATDDCGNSSSTTATFTIEDTTAPSVASASDMTVECDGAGNSAALNAWLGSNGGASASDACSGVSWSNDFAGLSDDCGATGSATVTFTATDDCGNSSSTTATFTIEDTTAPVQDACPADISLIADSSDCDPQVFWTAPGATDVCSGVTITSSHNPGDEFPVGMTTVTYTATDDCGNSTSCSFTVTITPKPLEITAIDLSVYNCGYNVTCNGSTDGSASVSVRGGCLPYAYNWSDGQTTETATGLGAGNYNVSITDANGTVIVGSATITEPDQLAVVMDADTDTLDCIPMDIEIRTTVSGGCEPYTYAWSNGETTSSIFVNPNVTTTYDVTVTDNNGCVVGPTDGGSFTLVVINRCGNNDQKVLICHVPNGNNQNPQTICISPNALNAHLGPSPGNSGSPTGLHGGDYCGPCIEAAKQPEYAGRFNLDINKGGFVASAFPNPTSGRAVIEFASENDQHVRIDLFTVTGQHIDKLYDASVEGTVVNFVEFDGTQFAEGTYIYRIITENGQHHGRIVLTK